MFAEKVVYLTELVRDAQEKYKIPRLYTDRFNKSNNEFLSTTDTIKIEDMINHFVVAGVVDRGEALPLIGRDGFNSLEFTPDVIGGKFPYSADDLKDVSAGVPVFTKDGTVPMTMEDIEKKYSEILAASIENRKERQAVDAYLKGIYIDSKGKELQIGQSSSIAVTWTSKLKSDEIIKLVQDYIVKFGVTPVVEAGVEVFNVIKNETKDSKQNINGVTYGMTNEGQKLLIGNFEIKMLTNAKGSDGNVVDTSKMVIISDPNTLGMGYAGITYGDTEKNTSITAKTKMIAAPSRVTETGQAGIFGMSAPMPVILSLDKFLRYTVTL